MRHLKCIIKSPIQTWMEKKSPIQNNIHSILVCQMSAIKLYDDISIIGFFLV